MATSNFLSSSSASLLLRSLAKRALKTERSSSNLCRSFSSSSPKRRSILRLSTSSPFKTLNTNSSLSTSHSLITTTTNSPTIQQSLCHLSTSPQTSAQSFSSSSSSSSSSNGSSNQSSTPNNNNNTITSHQVTIDGQVLHYEVAGSGPHVLLLLPGAIGTGRGDFEHQLRGLDGEQFTMVAWDPPGYGQSRPPEKDFNDFYRTDAAMAAKLMKKLNHHRYSVLGWSDGGITGMILTAGAGSSAVQKLIIWGANAYVNEEDRAAMHRVRNPATDWSPAFRDACTAIYGEEYFRRLWDRLVAHYMRLDDICKADLGAISCPVLILHGDLDPMISGEHPVHLVNNIGNATLYRFPKGKHNIHQRYAEEFNGLVADFLTGT